MGGCELSKGAGRKLKKIANFERITKKKLLSIIRLKNSVESCGLAKTASNEHAKCLAPTGCNRTNFRTR
jgi:hypothetical protein